MTEKMSVEWAREFLTRPYYSRQTAIIIYADGLPKDGEARYYLGAAVREETQGE